MLASFSPDVGGLFLWQAPSDPIRGGRSPDFGVDLRQTRKAQTGFLLGQCVKSLINRVEVGGDVLRLGVLVSVVLVRQRGGSIL